MKKIIYACLAFTAILSGACSEENVPLYNGCKAGLFIQEVYTSDIYGNPISYRDSTTFSFASVDEKYTEYSARFIVRTMGNTVNEPRPYKIAVLEGTTAVEGEDFDLSQNDFIVHANNSTDTVWVRLIRTSKLRTNTLRIKLGLVANEYFDLPIDYYKNSSSWSEDGPKNSATSYIVRFSEIYTQPSYWGWYGDEYFGTFTVNRYLELNKVMGWTTTDWSNAGMTGAKVAYGKMDFAARTFQRHLQKMADAGTPVLDDDGSYIQLPAKYAVDYSKYESNE